MPASIDANAGLSGCSTTGRGHAEAALARSLQKPNDRDGEDRHGRYVRERFTPARASTHNWLFNPSIADRRSAILISVPPACAIARGSTR